jgi:anti-sigma-K factor RskA
MNTPPSNPDLLEQLAAQYVLGTLRGPARRRVERWRASSTTLDERCRYWESQLMPMLRALRPIPPPPHVWSAVQRRLGLLEVRRPRGAALRSLAVAASLLMILGLGVLWYWRSTAVVPLIEVATVARPAGTPLWEIEIRGRPGETRHLRVRAGAGTSPPQGRDYELWALPEGGSPVSLGVLPSRAGSLERELTARQMTALSRASKVAVSVEPPGGSPTSVPTGAVVFVAPLHAPS